MRKSKLFVITLGVIIFIASIASVVVPLLALIFDEASEDNIAIALASGFVGTIIGTYVVLTNFGRTEKSDLAVVKEEKERLKEMIEISLLKKEIGTLENTLEKSRASGSTQARKSL